MNPCLSNKCSDTTLQLKHIYGIHVYGNVDIELNTIVLGIHARVLDEDEEIRVKGAL